MKEFDGFIPVVCFTNLDLFNQTWPKKLPIIIKKGDWIYSKEGRRLMIASISYRVQKDDSVLTEVELTTCSKRSNHEQV